MTDVPGFAAAAASIHAAFGRTVQYHGAGLAGTSVVAVRSHRPGESFLHGGTSVRELWYEIRKASLPGTPANEDRLTDRPGQTGAITLDADFVAEAYSVDAALRVIEVVDRDDVDAWLVKVEAP